MPKVTFMPDSVTIEVTAGENLLRAAMMADVLVTASCGGVGTCGKCRVIVEEGSVNSKPSSRLSEDEVARGYVLACAATVVGDVTVTVPPESRPTAAPQKGRSGRVTNPLLPAHELAARIPKTGAAMPVSKKCVTVPEPDLADNASDLTRVRIAFRSQHGLKDVEVTLGALRELPAALRQGSWTVTAVVHEPPNGPALITGFQAGDKSGSQYAFAVDVGTTSVEVFLIDLANRRSLCGCSEYNAQVARGEDVITRVIAASKGDGLEELQDFVVRTISELAVKCLAEAGVSASDIVAYVAAGNTVMTHLLLGISPASIRTSPYVPAASTFPWVKAAELGLPGSSATLFTAMPCTASWLGGDIIAGIVACGMPWSDTLTLLVDVGTNGEIVLGNKEFMVACSCSAGPAFEGGGIRHGMRAADGAIEQVRIDDATLEPSILTIGGCAPLGICGSGLIDCVSELFLAGAIDRNGKFVLPARSERVRVQDGRAEYVLVKVGRSGTGGDIVLTETDVENLMRAKAAIHAGIDVLVGSLDLTISDIGEFIVAGGFGHYLDLERITAIGMFPELPLGHYAFIGNSSLAGARLCATSSELLDRANKVAEALTYLELSVNPGFMEMYVSSMFLPHTDLSRFPETEKLRERRMGAGAVS